MEICIHKKATLETYLLKYVIYKIQQYNRVIDTIKIYLSRIIGNVEVYNVVFIKLCKKKNNLAYYAKYFAVNKPFNLLCYSRFFLPAA